MLAVGAGLCWDGPVAGQSLRNVIHMVHLQTALIFHKEKKRRMINGDEKLLFMNRHYTERQLKAAWNKSFY